MKQNKQTQAVKLRYCDQMIRLIPIHGAITAWSKSGLIISRMREQPQFHNFHFSKVTLGIRIFSPYNIW